LWRARFSPSGFFGEAFACSIDCPKALRLRSRFAPPLELLIDRGLTPRGFWGHQVGLPMMISEHMHLVDEERWPSTTSVVFE